MDIRTKRAYEAPGNDDGFRVLVDRLWPRGLKKENARIDLWLKEAAPSSELRKWFNHEPAKWDAFKRRYLKELAAKGDVLEPIRQEAEKGAVTLVYGSKEERFNNAAALKEFLSGKGAVARKR
ncbi:MAG: DUF488 family protein [Candidatus Abyssobacteria bacterium SURF_5]|uniref:DUF488 family protein n=1 Tax=Abyssobacteria bacterium (strain SURF_5) TaxID=2093360 RepID=A0A3A4MXM5_ABYX5|nr:MAG: DUF488 family protein [Candidatus Abyssubacteria bacterium SURF_5]